MTQHDMQGTPRYINKGELRKILTQDFNMTELRVLCFDLDEDSEVIRGDNKAEWVMNLIAYFDRHKRLIELVDYGRKKRPELAWDEVFKGVEPGPLPTGNGPLETTSDYFGGKTRSVFSVIREISPRWLLACAIVVAVAVWLYVTFIDSHDGRVKVAFGTAHNRYVTAMGADYDWLLMAQADVIDDYEEFTMLCQDDGKAAFQTWHKTAEGKNRYVTAMGGDADWIIMAETTEMLDYELFTLLNADTEVNVEIGEQRSCSEVVQSLKDEGEVRIAFQTFHTKDGKHRLVTAMDGEWGWVLRGETTELLANEKFTVTLLSSR